jgi:nucleoside-diphosphate-sugar epimerase
MERKVIVTGVAGFIGSNLAARLLNEGHQVIGIDNLSTGFKRNLELLMNKEGFVFIEGDLNNPSVYYDSKADYIIHLASQKIPRYTNALRTLEENTSILKLIINKCLLDGSKLIYASTSDVYGKNPNLPFNEDSDLQIGPTTVKRWAYAISKIYGEQLIQAYSDQYNLNFTICRFFGAFGPNQNLSWWGGPQSVFISNALKKQPLEVHGDGSQCRTFTYVSDTIDGLYRCIFKENASRQIFNVAGPPQNEITIKDLASTIWNMINPGIPPLIELKPYASFGKYEDVMRRVPDNSKIESMLGHKPNVMLKDGLMKTIDWQRQLV